jgi:hypothetical protein
MKKGDILICCCAVGEYYSSFLTVGNKYELIDSDAFVGPNGFEKIYLNVRCLVNNKNINNIPCHLFISLERYRAKVLEKLNI